MADHLANGLSEESISDYASSSAGTDPLEDFLNRYTFIIDPECCLKLHKSAGTARLGLNCFFRMGGSRRWTFVAKPADKSGNPWLHKLAVVPSRQLVQVSTAKKHIGSWLRLQVTADFDWETRRAGAHWKVSTKWNAGRNKLERKEKLRLADGMELRPHWRVDMYMPEVEGRLGAAAAGADGVRVERGHCHITVPRLDLVLPLDALAARGRALAARRRGAPDAEPEGAGPAGEAEGGSSAASPRATGEGAHVGRQRRDQAPRVEQHAPEARAPDAAREPGARWRWRRRGGAVGEAMEVPPEPPAPRPAWQTFLQRVQAQLPRRGGAGSAAEL